MKHRSLVGAALALLLIATICEAQIARRWDFNKIDDREGWEMRPGARGVVMGGSLWLTVATTPGLSARLYEGIGEPIELDPVMRSPLVASARGLNIPAERATQVRLRILNLSPVTDLFLRWRTTGQDWELPMGWAAPPTQSKHCALKADLKQWQEVTCYLDRKEWRGVIDQIAIQLPTLSPPFRGDMWIDWIEIGSGAAQPVRPRPDVVSSHVVPRIQIPHISQAGFADAFKVLDECLVVDVPNQGFNYPYMGPGGYYGDLWHVLDTSLTLNGAKWVNQSFAEGVMRGFREVQAEEPNDRIPGAGYRGDRGQPADWSQTPRFFEVAYDVARRTSDAALRADIYDTMRRYLDWWVSAARRDAKSGFVMALGDDFDTLSEEVGWTYPPAVAAVDLNMAVMIGAERVSRLAAHLGKNDEAVRYKRLFQDLSGAVNRLWDEKDGVYYNHDLSTGQPRRRVLASTFEPLRFGTASPAQRKRLIERLIDPKEFNWGKVPLTTIAMTDAAYEEAKGDYGFSAWNGDVWTYRNLEAIKGLEDAGRPDLAAELNWATIKEFHQNYHEYLLPSTGEGQGTNRYGWTASQYIEAVIEHLFGVDFDAIQRRVRIAPHVPKELYGQDIALRDLLLPTGGGTRLLVHVHQISPTAASIRVDITGPLPQGDLMVTLPGSGKERRVSMRHTLTTTFD